VSLVSCGYWMDYPDKKSHVVGHPEGGLLTRGETYLKLTNVFGSPMKGYSWNKAYKTAIIKKYHLRFDCDISLLEDQIFNVKYISVCKGVYYTQKPYYHYWQRKGSIIHQPNIKKVADNFRGNYRVWHKIIKTMLKDREDEKLRKKMDDNPALRDSDAQ
nr:glycosyltransferase family 2 protein [Lactobacillus amylovorus]